MNLLKSEKPLLLDGFLLKVLAFLFMTVDHIGVFMAMKGGNPDLASAFRSIGRFAFPLFAFLLAEGMRLSHHKGRYLLRTGLLYLIITLPETILVYVPALSEFIHYGPQSLDPHPFTDIFFLALALYCLNLKGPKKLFALFPIAFFITSYYFDHYDFSNPYFPYYLRSGYSLFGLVITLGFFGVNVLLDHLQTQGKEIPRLLRNLCNISVFLLSYGLVYLIMMTNAGAHSWMDWEVYALFSAVLLLFYDGKRGYDAPWWRVFSYSYFLLHMAVLYLIFSLIP